MNEPHVFICDDVFVAMVASNERRLVNGLLDNPPKLYALIWSEEHDRLELHAVTWAVATALLPGSIERLGSKIKAYRNEAFERRMAECRPAASAAAPASVAWVGESRGFWRNIFGLGL